MVVEESAVMTELTFSSACTNEGSVTRPTAASPNVHLCTFIFVPSVLFVYYFDFFGLRRTAFLFTASRDWGPSASLRRLDTVSCGFSLSARRQRVPRADVHCRIPQPARRFPPQPKKLGKNI